MPSDIKCISRSVCSEPHNILTPFQVGVGVPGGCKAIVHAVTQVQEGVRKETLLLDFSNALSGGEGSHSIYGCLDGVLLWCSSLPPFG